MRNEASKKRREKVITTNVGRKENHTTLKCDDNKAIIRLTESTFAYYIYTYLYIMFYVHAL